MPPPWLSVSDLPRGLLIFPPPSDHNVTKKQIQNRIHPADKTCSVHHVEPRAKCRVAKGKMSLPVPPKEETCPRPICLWEIGGGNWDRLRLGEALWRGIPTRHAQ
ncbi:hypothetical protein NL676_010175 [Syzygium grande]|nr:hypothetical protein NL676_010175 [Syzygium grande]